MQKDNKHIKLNDIPKRDIYKTPENYFDTLYNRINENIIVEKKVVKPKSKTIYWKLSYGLAAAVTLFIIAFIGYSQMETPSAEEILNEVSSDDCITYLNESEIDLNEIIEISSGEYLEAPFEIENDDFIQFNEDELDLLYKHYGVSADTNMLTL